MNFIRLCLIASGIYLSGCKTVVDHWTPEGGQPKAPDRFEHAQSGDPSVPAAGKWWRVFRDPILNDLMADVESHNPSVKAALARMDQAYATLGVTKAQLFPSVTSQASFNTERDSPNTLRFPIDEVEFDRYRVAVNASWEVDLWGRIRAAYKRDRFNADAARDLYLDTLLSLRASLARQYFALRFVEREMAILREAVAVRQEALRLQNALADRGASSDVNVARARTELESTRAELEGLERTRGKLEHAIATLTGRAPSEFALPRQPVSVRSPSIPSGVPSTLLVRRPDLRAAENNLRAASQEIGITKANFLPRLTLTGAGGQASLRSDNLFAGTDSYFFSLGPQLDIPVFQAGRRKSALAEAKARWDEVAENYRSTLLTAVQEVDDSLLDLHVLSRQVGIQQAAVDSAARATELAQKRFDQGAASYFEVVDAQRTELQAKRTANALRGEQAAASVQLIQALGGEW